MSHRPKYPKPLMKPIPTTRRETNTVVENSDIDLQVKYAPFMSSNERDCYLSFNFKGTRLQVDKLFSLISKGL